MPKVRSVPMSLIVIQSHPDSKHHRNLLVHPAFLTSLGLVSYATDGRIWNFEITRLDYPRCENEKLL